MRLTSITYPLTINNGSLNISASSDTIKQQIISVIETQPGERIMQPLYGFKDKILSSLSPAIVVSDIENTIQRYVPLAKNVKVTYTNDSELFEQGKLLITIYFDYDNKTTSFRVQLSDE